MRSDLHGHGVGWALMTGLLDYAAAGINEIVGDTMARNAEMLTLGRISALS